MRRTRYSDCDIGEFKVRDALREVSDAHIVDAAMADILAGAFDSAAVHEVMQRRAGSKNDYDRIKEARAVAVAAARHSGARA